MKSNSNRHRGKEGTYVSYKVKEAEGRNGFSRKAFLPPGQKRTEGDSEGLQG